MGRRDRATIFWRSSAEPGLIHSKSLTSPSGFLARGKPLLSTPNRRAQNVSTGGVKATCNGVLRGASRSLDAVRMASKSKKKPPTTSSDGDESPRWREGTAAPRDAEIVPPLAVLEINVEFRIFELGLVLRISDELHHPQIALAAGDVEQRVVVEVGIFAVHEPPFTDQYASERAEVAPRDGLGLLRLSGGPRVVRGGLRVPRSPRYYRGLRGASRSETTHFMVRWTRVASMA